MMPSFVGGDERKTESCAGYSAAHCAEVVSTPYVLIATSPRPHDSFESKTLV